MSTNISLYLTLALLVISALFFKTSLRIKFLLFIVLTILFSIWGFLHNLDGMMLILLTAEFTIILLFLMTYLQLYSNFTFLTNTVNYIIYFPAVILILTSPNLIETQYSYTAFYQAVYHTVSSDFFVLYYLLFDKIPLLTIFVTVIIALFSLFFILMYFNLKLIKNYSNIKLKNLFFLRKQNLTKQTKFNSKLYTFQN